MPELRTEDFRYYSNLPYATTQYMGEGWALVGDAAVFLDPYYSPGLDHCAFSSEATAEIVAIDLAGKPIVARTKEHNETFVRSYWRFFEAIFKDKYYYMGEADLLSAAFLLDTAQYYIFVVIPAYRVYGRFFWMPVLGPKEAFFNYKLMKFYNRRFKALAELRREMGEAGRQERRPPHQGLLRPRHRAVPHGSARREALALRRARRGEAEPEEATARQAGR